MVRPFLVLRILMRGLEIALTESSSRAKPFSGMQMKKIVDHISARTY
jgi:hypothetical protein